MLTVQGLRKIFRLSKKASSSEPRAINGEFPAVNGLNFDAKRGEVIGLLGANGAGKTTTLRLLAGIMKATSGQIDCALANPQTDRLAYRRQLGFLSGSKGLYDRLTVRENLHYFGRLYQLRPTQLTERVSELSDLLALESFLDRRVSDLSTGMRQRAAIARALVQDPQLIVFDEPTTGLDIVATERVLQCMEQLKLAGKTILFATHHLEEVSLLCDRILVVDQGEQQFFGSIESFLTRYDSSHLNQALRVCLGLTDKGLNLSHAMAQEGA